MSPTDPVDFDLRNEDLAWYMLESLLTMRRIYDVQLALLADATSADKSRELQAMHERGEYLAPPAWVPRAGTE